MILVPRPQVRQERRWLTALVATLLAIVGHALLVGLFLVLSHLELNVPVAERAHRTPTPKAVTLRGLTAQQWAQNRGESKVKDERTVIAKNREEKKKDKVPETMPKGQIVDVAPGNGEVDPNAKFISETNNVAKKETRAKEQTAFYRNAMPQRTSPTPVQGNGTAAVDKAQVSGNNGLADDDRPLRAVAPKLAMEVPDVKARSEVAMKMNGEGPGAQVSNRTETEAVKGNSQRLKIVPGTGDEEGSQGRQGQPGALSLLPSPAVLDKITGAAANDHLRDVDEGEGTYLSTREWKYAGFFNRVKQSVGQQWDPQQQMRLRDPSMQIYGGRDRYTILQVSLTQDGRLKDAYVEKSSGVDFLDLEAIKAFERAQPFPNPPSGLLASDQLVHFQFGFFLEMSGRPGLRLFRQTD